MDSCNHCTVLLEPFNLQQGFTSNSELHIRRLFKKYNKNLHKSDLRRVSTLYTFYSIMLIREETRSAAANMFQLRNNGLEFFYFFKVVPPGPMKTKSLCIKPQRLIFSSPGRNVNIYRVLPHDEPQALGWRERNKIIFKVILILVLFRVSV